ncbi:phage baseplate plug family protein [Entomobacter blattae]|uniref:Cyanophage baseplate Pam3 plug gp18 domain-containing protein n=1 Tax=Entomobacter blattae TaxID=2762277 RepID=A0A7H1NU41_9PROT|nr:hypothetical protein [Entomobacter blattae]QNT79301.1 hypothetical protein JGUZn3_20980 [Entomobacter blattae]
MVKQLIPLNPVSNQNVRVGLGGQNVQLRIDTKLNIGTFIDVYLAGEPVILGMQCRNNVPMIQLAYLGFRGDLTFYDMQGNSDPFFTGFGSRYILVWDSEAKLQ